MTRDEAALAAWRRKALRGVVLPEVEPEEEVPGNSEAARLYRVALPVAEVNSPIVLGWLANAGLDPKAVPARVLPRLGHPIFRALPRRWAAWAETYRVAVPLWRDRELVDLAGWDGTRWSAAPGLVAATPAARRARKGSPVSDLDAFLATDRTAPHICRIPDAR